MEYNIGDKVIVTGPYHKEVCTISKITPSGNIRLSNNRLYSANGSEKTSRWGTRFEKATDEKLLEIKKSNIIRTALLKMRDTVSLNYEQAIQILYILNQKE